MGPSEKRDKMIEAVAFALEKAITGLGEITLNEIANKIEAAKTDEEAEQICREAVIGNVFKTLSVYNQMLIESYEETINGNEGKFIKDIAEQELTALIDFNPTNDDEDKGNGNVH